MNLIRFLCFFTTIASVAKSSAEADDVSLLTKARRLFDSKHLLRGSGLNSKRMLEVGTKRLLQLIEINFDSIDINIDSININIGCNGDESNDYDNDNNDDNVFNNDDESSNPPMNELVKFVASDGERYDKFGASCSMSDELVVIGATGNVDGAAYIFNLNGTEVAKLKPNEGNKTEDRDYFGISVSIDEKIVVGSLEKNVEVFSRNGTYERTLTCCWMFGSRVATLGNLIVTYGKQNSIWKLFIYGTDGELLNAFEQEGEITDVAISEKYIVSTSPSRNGNGKTFIYNNTSPDFPKVAEIDRKGSRVAVSNGRLVIGDGYANNNDGVAYLYKTDGTLVTALDRQDAPSFSYFGGRVAITDDKVFAKAKVDDGGENTGSVFIYSATTGDLIKKVVADKTDDGFGSSVCASDSYFVVGASGDDDNGVGSGAAYLFQLSED